MRRIFFLILSTFLFLANTVLSQVQEMDSLLIHEEKTKNNTAKIFYGMSVHLDIATPIINYVAVDRSIIAAECAVDVNFMQKYFPIVEIGYASVDKVYDLRKYKTSAPYFRIGINLNLLRTKDKDGVEKNITNYPYLGVRYGFSVFNYRLVGAVIEDTYWGQSATVEPVQKSTYAGWLELVAGVRVNVSKGFTMGWSVRLGFLSHTVKSTDKAQLWYIPGFGLQNTLNAGFNYTLGYTFAVKEKTNIKNIKPL